MSNIFKSSIGRKIAMALSGIFLIVFLTQHFLINITSVFSEEIFNMLSHFMGNNPLVQFILQPILIGGVLFHFIMGFYLEIQNRKAAEYEYQKEKGNATQANKTFKKCLEKITKAKVNDVYTLARKWNSIGEYDLAIKAYLKGKEVFPKQEFGFQLASAYRNTGKTEKMIETYIDLVVKKSSNKRNIQIILQNTLGRTKTSDSYQLLKEKLLVSIQQTNNIDLMEMLVWLLIETENYNLAFTYTKAIEKQITGDGTKIFSLGQLAHENSQYDAAIKCYQYLIAKKTIYAVSSKILKLIATSEKTLDQDFSATDLQNLKSKYSFPKNRLGI